MKSTASLALPLIVWALAATIDGQGWVGDRLSAPELEGFANTKATAFGEFAGRAVLLEFFAYW